MHCMHQVPGTLPVKLEGENWDLGERRNTECSYGTVPGTTLVLSTNVST